MIYAYAVLIEVFTVNIIENQTSMSLLLATVIQYLKKNIKFLAHAPTNYLQ